MRVSVVIPMYNETKIIAQTARTLHDFMSSSFENFEVIFVDDGSTDNSRNSVNELGLENVRAIGYAKNRGKGCAVRHGMLAASGDIRIFTDADLAYGTDVIRLACDKMAEKPDIDILLGSRNASGDGYEGYTLRRKIMSKLYIRVLCAFGGFDLSDSQCGFKAFRAKTADEVFSKCTLDGFSFDFEVILRAKKANKSFAEMPVKIINHRGSSIRPIKDTLKMLRDIRIMKKNIKSEESVR